ncbi:uncharacterized protein LOC133037839 [Cannabis sativa]|uniref:uncharacterized protein LOC133037839 n=1 Tax=Cannabis sativa TaxID=3483 RepID=UPI0029C9BA3F|nr:uncharacterized protein LOC133037839 [Cannabis sativa]XP_060971470.1 uncharacterized protein LOC133037839 [Cannabis sativa]
MAFPILSSLVPPAIASTIAIQLKSYLDSSAASSSSISNWEIMSSHDHENNFNFMTHNYIRIDMDVDIDHYTILGLPMGEDGANKLTEKKILKVYTCNQINYLISFVLVIVLIVHILI